jgi:homopolymeric O-antigen transport system ATP-binding protein
MSDVALQMEHVSKRFKKGELHDSLRDLLPAVARGLFRRPTTVHSDTREFWALQDVSFEARRGEAFGIIGRNGAGKSTMLKILSRIMKPTSGRMVVKGRLSALIEISAGFHPDLTGRENIFLNGAILGMSKKEIKSRLDEIVAFSELEEFIDTPVKRYSSGMYARLGFSVAAHVDPEILLVDEVLSVGDLVFQQRCMERMHAVTKSGTTVLFISHNVKAVTELCQRAMLLDHGRVVTIDSTDAVVRRYLDEAQDPTVESSKQAVISNVTVSGERGQQNTFESGQKGWIDVEVTARERVEKVAIVLGILDEHGKDVFGTSTERLGAAPFSLDPGERYRCRFELTLNMAHGTFHVAAALHRYDIHKQYDHKPRVATIFVGSSTAVLGSVNCFPKVIDECNFSADGSAALVACNEMPE